MTLRAKSPSERNSRSFDSTIDSVSSFLRGRGAGGDAEDHVIATNG
jgi:hypothetical protein